MMPRKESGLHGIGICYNAAQRGVVRAGLAGFRRGVYPSESVSRIICKCVMKDVKTDEWRPSPGRFVKLKEAYRHLSQDVRKANSVLFS